MADDIPPWLQAMRAITGLTEYSNGSNPKIEAMAAFIGQKFPPQADYASLYTDDSIAWCGVTAAFCMAVADISGPFGATDTDKWMWALSWANDPNYTHLPSPVQGCLVAMERSGGGHITIFEEWSGGMLACRGGNQSDAVTVDEYDPDTVVAYVWPMSYPIPAIPRSSVGEGASGPEVMSIQTTLGVHPVDGDFGGITDSAVKGYQGACSLTADGEVGPATWEKLDELDTKVIAGTDGLPPNLIAAISDTARHSSIARYDWGDNRGVAPVGYIIGMALSFALAVARYNTEDDAAYEMARAVDVDDDDTDAMAWYEDEFEDEGMDNSEDGLDTLRHLFVLMIGLGMRESSGRYSEGRDQSASNVSADTAEASLFQTSWNIRSCRDEIPPLLSEYWDNPCGFRAQFQEGVSLKESDLGGFGTGGGAQYQFLSKYAPAFHVFVTAVGLRNARKHWGPINERAVELRSEADAMLQAIQALVEEGMEPPEPEPEPEPDNPQVMITAKGKVKIEVTGDVDVYLNGEPWEED
jgi:uncharacterized protein (TIGR02594 family)